MTTTLASILRAETIVTAEPDNRCHDEWLACDGALKVTFQRNDFLNAQQNTTSPFMGLHCEYPDVSDTRCTIFGDDATLEGFDTIVVNSGAHPRPADRYGPAMGTASKKIAASMRRLHGEADTILVVRNTIPGHWDCNER